MLFFFSCIVFIIKRKQKFYLKQRGKVFIFKNPIQTPSFLCFSHLHHPPTIMCFDVWWAGGLEKRSKKNQKTANPIKIDSKTYFALRFGSMSGGLVYEAD